MTLELKGSFRFFLATARINKKLLDVVRTKEWRKTVAPSCGFVSVYCYRLFLSLHKDLPYYGTRLLLELRQNKQPLGNTLFWVYTDDVKDFKGDLIFNACFRAIIVWGTLYKAWRTANPSIIHFRSDFKKRQLLKNSYAAVRYNIFTSVFTSIPNRSIWNQAEHPLYHEFLQT